ncbi:DUF3039 domain-containing protein [Trueperella pecoris]|uniref:DUF3039 domain-containing protein n=1 Tax=Trueperella pecoris TaxID=2733571 RepID=A0A7M1QSW0_9ACTO|nr:DUF3039 domain-containing protein [Trueperella pecoris]QOQ38560.1 DUF3039 domain-containing protein [Trueperella pecoris]QOR44946.1 DUF3039 domain-containing protein [Trueperella pecoris]QTG74855.1 DUF3039 domain-containing protein [Trueperella pecoris]
MSTDPHSDPQAPGGPGQPAAPSLAPESTTATLERTREAHEPGDEDRYAHYVRKDRITQSAVEGGPVVALCGKVWTPVRNPDRYPICPTCKAIYQNMGKGGDAWPFGPNPPGGNGNGQGGAQ